MTTGRINQVTVMKGGVGLLPTPPKMIFGRVFPSRASTANPARTIHNRDRVTAPGGVQTSKQRGGGRAATAAPPPPATPPPHRVLVGTSRAFSLFGRSNRKGRRRAREAPPARILSLPVKHRAKNNSQRDSFLARSPSECETTVQGSIDPSHSQSRARERRAPGEKTPPPAQPRPASNELSDRLPCVSLPFLLLCGRRTNAPHLAHQHEPHSIAAQSRLACDRRTCGGLPVQNPTAADEPMCIKK